MWKVNFNINRPSTIEVNAEINGMKVSVSQGSDQLVTEVDEACDEVAAQEKAHKVANQFLDTLCWKYNSTLKN